MSELAQMRGMMEVLLKQTAEMRAMLEEKQAPLTVTEFAKRIGRHPNTVHRWIDQGLVVKTDRGIPYSELRRLLS